jgi:hypothetical protein
VNENARAFATTAAGALVGGVVTYLFFTGRGRSFRYRVDRTLDDLSNEVSRFRGTLTKAANMANEGRNLYSEGRNLFSRVFREREEGFAHQQTSPF